MSVEDNNFDKKLISVFIFCGFVPGRQDLPSDSRAFSLTSLERAAL